MQSEYSVFLDKGGRRWTRVRLAVLFAATLVFLCLVAFVHALYVAPSLRSPAISTITENDFKVLIKQDGQLPQPKPPKIIAPKKDRTRRNFRGRGSPNNSVASSFVRVGFYVDWDPNSMASLEQNSSKLTHVTPEWFSMEDNLGGVDEVPAPQVSEFADSHDLSLVPLLTNLHDDVWHPEAVENLAHGPQVRRDAFFHHMVNRLIDIGADGLLIDWEEVDPFYRDEVTSLLAQFSAVLHEKNLEIWLSVPVEADLRVFDVESLSPYIDRFVALLFDQTGERDAPGPLATREWFASWLETLMEYGDPEQWIIGLGNFGYDWPEGGTAQTISFADALSRAQAAGVDYIDTDPPFHEPHFNYTDHGAGHSVWFLDAISFRNQKLLARKAGVGGIALFRLGTEDPLVWQFMASHHGIPHSQLKRIKPSGEIAHIGKGELITFEDRPSEGRRQISISKDGMWDEDYTSLPKYPVILHKEAVSPDLVALSFDDGPSAEWTPQILDILKEYGAKATFFVTGVNASANPALIKRIVDEGHLLGNHSFSHPDLSQVSTNRVTLELNATQRVIEGITGLSTILFRPPYNSDANPPSLEKSLPLLVSQKLGYLNVMAAIDSEDWNWPTQEDIIDRVKTHRNEGNIILLHDGGGDRYETVHALPVIIDYLRMRGDTIVPLTDLYQMSVQSVMPPLAPEDQSLQMIIAKLGLQGIQKAEELIWAFLIVATIMVLIRALAILALAWVHRRREERQVVLPQKEAPPVSIVIAAFNEEKVIASTIRSVLNSSYQGALEVVVVDDGSVDNTAKVVEGIVASDSRVRLLSQVNSGKSMALQKGLGSSRHEMVVMLDADTQFEPETIGALIDGLTDRSVGAISGHARVGNKSKALTRYQGLEYICGFNLDRAAYDVLNCITVAPGAVSAYRRSAIKAAGGMSPDTLAEDTDLTLNIHRAGYRVAYTSAARAWTEAPETIHSFVRQRTRWAFGTVQALWKNRDLVFDPQYGALAFFSMPGLWFFQLFLVALVPLADLFLLVSVMNGNGVMVAIYAGAFMVVDILLAVSACLLGNEPVKQAIEVVPMRIVYRPLLSWAVWCAGLRVLKGAWVGWEKQERKGTVLMPACASKG